MNNLPPCEAYSRALSALDYDSSCLPLATGIDQVLKIYSNAVKAGDDNLMGIVRHLLAAKDLPEYIVKSRQNTLDAMTSCTPKTYLNLRKANSILGDL